MALRQTFQQKMLQKLSPQQIQLMKLLQVPTIELEERIKEEMEENPALEEGREESDTEQDEYDEGLEDQTEAEKEFDITEYLDDDVPSYKTSIKNKGVDDDDKAVPISSGISFQEVLSQQIALRDLDTRELEITEHLIGNLDESGYLRRELENIVDDLMFAQNISTSEEELERLLDVVQTLDPPGVGARGLQECLLIQLNRKGNSSMPVVHARMVLKECFDEFTKKHYTKILDKLELEEADLKAAIAEIVKLNPKPGNSLKSTNSIVQHVIPDFIITEEEEELQLSLNGRNAPDLRVNRTYSEMLHAYADNKEDKQAKEAALFVKQKLDSAKWFIDAIKQRQQTLLFTMTAIMNYQKEFFLTGDETKLKPMILKDIAEIVQMDISTVSRVSNSKYVQTIFGTFLLKFFFSESLSTDSGEEVSTREVKKILQDAVEDENKQKPLTDEKLMDLLKSKGYNIARRTVAKYREQLNISVARLRKEL